MQRVHQYLIETALRLPKKTALIVDNKDLTYEELVRKVNLLAEVLLQHGIHKGSRTLIMLHDKEEFIVGCLAAMRAGSIAVPLTERESVSSIQQAAKVTGASILITDQTVLANYPLLLDKWSCDVVTLSEIEFLPSLHGEQKDEHNDPQIPDKPYEMNLHEDDGALILFAPTVNGEKQGVFFSHRNLIKITNHINEVTKINADCREYVTTLLTNPFGFGRCLCLLFVGGTIILTGGAVDPESITMRVLHNRCNGISSSTEAFFALLGNAKTLSVETALQIRFINTDASSMTVEQKKKLLEKFPNAHFWTQYGTTEAPCVTLIEYRSKHEKLQTIGYPAEGMEIAILDERGKSIGRGRVGEIAVQGEFLAKSYWNNDHVGDPVIADGEWFNTGDIGFVDNHGYLHYLGRKEEVINRGDIKILPLEVEEKIREAYPDCEICIVGIPDPAGLFGEIPVLCYTASKGKTIIPSELSNALSKRLDRNKIPRIVFRIDDFPRFENKISRFELKNRILQGNEFYSLNKFDTSGLGENAPLVNKGSMNEHEKEL